MVKNVLSDAANKHKPMEEKEAYNKLATMCATAEHCAHELVEKMNRWNIGKETQENIISRLKEERYIDERRYSRAFVSDKLKYNKWGPIKISYALSAKHIDEDVIQESINSIDGEEWNETLSILLRNKQKAVKSASEYELKGKLIRFALSHGFTTEQALTCLDKL
ncbi:MAG: regulatory protein RecX [Prevotella sp.]